MSPGSLSRSQVALAATVDSLRRASLSSLPTSSARKNLPLRLERRLKAVIKLDIINRVAEKTGVPKMKAEQAVDALFHSMKEALTRGERIELRGFGVFVVKPRKRGVGRNPRTGEEVAIPSGKTIRFKPGKDLQVSEDGKLDGQPDSTNPEN
jgi:DNA-binding protein HU-beta